MSYSQNYDLNDDGSVNSSDVVLLYNYICNGGTSGGGDTLVVGPSDDIIDEPFNWEAVVPSVYSCLSQFEEARRTLEKLRLERQEDHLITPNSSEVSNSWQLAYQTLNMIEHLLSKIDLTASNLTATARLRVNEMIHVKSYIYYHLATLWGRVPVLKGATTGAFDDNIVYMSAQEVYDYCLNECRWVDVEGEESELNSSRFNRQSWQVLKAEILLTKGEKENALKCLEGLPEKDIFVIYGLDKESGNYTVPLPLYSAAYVGCLRAEAQQSYALALYNELTSPYGLWAAYKRLGVAQSQTNCLPHELLMPYPVSELQLNPNLTQNPGY
ncbi:MAG: hypothetical protein ACI4TS_04965 [Bacteroidaceae bacterium]